MRAQLTGIADIDKKRPEKIRLKTLLKMRRVRLEEWSESIRIANIIKESLCISYQTNWFVCQDSNGCRTDHNLTGKWD